MKYTIMFISNSGSFAVPQMDDVKIVKSKKSIAEYLEWWCKQHDKVGADRKNASIWISKGVMDYIEYPDFNMFYGPRGGVQIERC